jgi:hypothetical protein
MLTMRVGVKPHLGCMQRWLRLALHHAHQFRAIFAEFLGDLPIFYAALTAHGYVQPKRRTFH